MLSCSAREPSCVEISDDDEIVVLVFLVVDDAACYCVLNIVEWSSRVFGAVEGLYCGVVQSS